MGIPNGYGKFVYVYKNDETDKFSFVYLGYFVNGYFHGQGKKLNGKGYK